LSWQPLPVSRSGPILILANALSIRNLLCRSLERRGYLSLEIEHARDLATELRHGRAELLIIDVSSTTGVETAIALARIHPNFKILAIVAASLDDNQIPGRLQVLPRPFGLDRFVNCVDRLLHRSDLSETGER
jgi:DNA-binding NtrC family response regulator